MAAQIRRVLFALLCASGGLAGVFLLLCAGGHLDPAALFPPDEGAVTASAPATVQENTPFRAAVLPAEDLDQAVFLAAGCDGVVIPMKTADGRLEYVSRLDRAADNAASSGDPDRNAALRSLNAQPGVYTVAMVSCFRDGLAAESDPMLSLRRPSGSPWLDRSGAGWLDPAQPEVQAYLIGICRELAGLGFDEILLTHCAYPPTAELAGAPDRAGTLETFCRQLQGSLSPWGTALSIQGEGDAAAPEAASGQTPALLATFPGRVWAAEADRAALSAFAPVLLPEP